MPSSVRRRADRDDDDRNVVYFRIAAPFPILSSGSCMTCKITQRHRSGFTLVTQRIVWHRSFGYIRIVDATNTKTFSLLLYGFLLSEVFL